MSKPTLQERAAAYLAEVRDMRGSAVHLAAFAAEEVARVREAQAIYLARLRLGDRVGVNHPRYNRTVIADDLDATTRSERPARAMLPTLPPGRRVRGDMPMPGKSTGLSTLAKAAKKGKRP